MSQPLKDKLAIVTGGSRGIGAAIARRLASDGAAVVVNYARSADAARAVVDEITKSGGRAEAIQADLDTVQGVRNLFQETSRRFGRPADILINNAGVGVMKPIEQMTEEDYDAQMNVNARAPYLAALAAAKEMPDGGRIINIGSILGTRSPFPGLALYSMSKAAVAGLTRGLARDLGPRNITVNNIQPGPIDTDMNPADSENAAPQIAMTALGRYGQAREIADTVAFLASPGASFITGTTIDVAGGVNA